nr:olfactomedin-like protein 2A isoform X2 [Ciona intestinalis]|eukprot:XP_002125394.2 olfactomedin-like protein 2A isoform X2 [Ciona intestinalis]
MSNLFWISTWVWLGFVLSISAFNPKHLNSIDQLRTVSEGTDCKCRCLMRVEDGGPCPTMPNKRKTLYYVDTVSGGTDCRCSCIAPAPPKDCEPEPTSSPGNIERDNDPVITIPLSHDVMGNRISVTISGSADASDSLHSASKVGNLEEVLNRAVTGMNVIKMHSSVTKMVLAMLDLEQVLSTNFTEETKILRRNIVKVAKQLEQSNNYSDVKEILNQEIERFDRRLKETVMDPDPASKGYAVEISEASTNNPTTTTPLNDVDNVQVPHLISVEERFSSVLDDSSVAVANYKEVSNTTFKDEIKMLNRTGLDAVNFTKLNTTSNVRYIFHKTSLNGTLSGLVRRVFYASWNSTLSVNDGSNVVRASESVLAVNNTESFTSEPSTKIELTPTTSVLSESTEPSTNKEQTTRPVQPLLSFTTTSSTNFETSAYVSTSVTPTTPDTTQQSSTEAETSQDNTSKVTDITQTSTATAYTQQTPAQVAKAASVVGSINFEPYRRQEQPVVVEASNATTEEYYDDSYYEYEDKHNSDTHTPLVGGRPNNSQQDEFDVASSTSSTVATTSSTILPTDDYDGVKENYLIDSNDDEYDDEDYYTYDVTTLSPRIITTTTTTTTTTTQPTTVSATIGPCGTLYNLSHPRTVHNFGRKEGAWMKDVALPSTKKSKIYVTNFYYGNNLIEFDTLYKFKHFRWSNSYILPYNWIGTGHIVYNGSFYYNRAFSKNLIKYNLKYRFVSAWGHLRDARYDSTTPFTWRGHSKVQLAADSSGLWVIYPANTDFNDRPNTQTFIISKINPIDLQTLRTRRIIIHRRSVSHVFMVCGVLYATDKYDARRARITHAYDTHTGVRRALYLPYINKFSYNVQLLYHPKERRIYSWDNGHQVIYDVNMSH